MGWSSAGTLRMPFLSSDGVFLWAGGLIITVLLCPLVIHSHWHHWQEQSRLGLANPEALERNQEQFGQKILTGKERNRKGREIKAHEEHLSERD